MNYEQKILEEIQIATSKGLRIGQLFDNCKSLMQKDGIDMFFADNNTLLKYILCFTQPEKTLDERVDNIEAHLVRLEIEVCNQKKQILYPLCMP